MQLTRMQKIALLHIAHHYINHAGELYAHKRIAPNEEVESRSHIFAEIEGCFNEHYVTEEYTEEAIMVLNVCFLRVKDQTWNIGRLFGEFSASWQAVMWEGEDAISPLDTVN